MEKILNILPEAAIIFCVLWSLTGLSIHFWLCIRKYGFGFTSLIEYQVLFLSMLLGPQTYSTIKRAEIKKEEMMEMILAAILEASEERDGEDQIKEDQINDD
jgi:hypothetical protein